MKSKKKKRNSGQDNEKVGSSRFGLIKKSAQGVSFLPLLKLLASSTVVAGVYILCLTLEFGPIMIIYAVLLSVLFVLFMLLNGNFRIKEPDTDDAEAVKRVALNKKRAKSLLLLIIPLIFTILIDNIYINFIK